MTKDASGHGHWDGRRSSSFANRRRVTTAATWASSLPALGENLRARSSWLAATAGKSAAKSGGGIELAARARSSSEVTPQALQRALRTNGE